MNQVLKLILRMKRSLTLIVIIAVAIIGFMTVRGTMPFMPVFGTSMEPNIHAGNLILINTQIEASEVKEGDVIVFNVPPAIQDYYNYPPIIAHRVLKVQDTEFGIGFRTKGDNSGEDPFTVRTQDLRGTVSTQIPYLGFPLLFLQSRQGLIFVIVALLLLAFYFYSSDLGRGGQKVHRGLFAPVLEESQRSSEVLAQRIETTEKGMETTQQALTSFASAIAEYAEHLKSHTSAIQGLSEASQELKKGAAEQNKVLQRIAESMEQRGPISEVTPMSEEVTPTIAPEAKKVKFPPGCVRSRQHANDEPIFGAS